MQKQDGDAPPVALLDVRNPDLVGKLNSIERVDHNGGASFGFCPGDDPGVVTTQAL
jgi:hypothetical protein